VDVARPPLDGQSTGTLHCLRRARTWWTAPRSRTPATGDRADPAAQLYL